MALPELRQYPVVALLMLLCCGMAFAADVWDQFESHKRLRQYRDASALLEPLCQRGDARACRELAQFYRNGLGVTRDVGKSAALLRISADQGDVDAQYQFGVMLANGSAGRKDIAGARRYLTQAANSGNSRAADYLHTLPKSAVDNGDQAGIAITVAKPPKIPAPKKAATTQNADASNNAQMLSAARASGVSALTLAIERGSLALTQQALATTTNAWAVDAQGHTPITRAALYDKPAVLQYLLAQSNGKGLVGANGRSALFYAVDGNSSASIKPLLDAGIDTTTADARGVSIVEYALQNRSAMALTLLAATPQVRWQAQWLPLAAEHGDQAFCLHMIHAGSAIDATDKRSHTALWHAVSQNNAGLANALLASGAATFAKDGDGNTLLHLAARNASPAMVDALIPRFKTGNLIDVRNNAGDSALHMASAAGADAVVDHLLANGANKDLRGNAGNTPLMLAVLAHNLKVIDRLLGAGVDIGIRNDNKKNALGIAQQLDYHDIEARLQQAARQSGVMSIFN
jgi:ankyrin repeat protein